MDKITVKYGKLKKIIETLEKSELTDDTDVAFEYVVGSCFPDVYNNIKHSIKEAYTKGYIEGLNEHDVEPTFNFYLREDE